MAATDHVVETRPDETWRELVERIGRDEYGVEVAADEVEFILWERTAFPFAPVGHVIKQLCKYFDDQTCKDRNGE